MRQVSRRFANALLVLYAVLVGGLPLADAILPAATQLAEAHIEDSTERHHGSHDHVSCQICRAIDRQVALEGDMAPPVREVPVATGAISGPDAVPPAATPRAELGARGPPTA
jgi:hypothetical protein